MPLPPQATRREFLRTSAAIVGTAAACGPIATHAATSGVHVGVDETLRVGLVGCGNRGKGAALDALAADSNSRLVAVGDVFRDRADECVNYLRNKEDFGARVSVDSDHVFSDFDNYRHVIDTCDVVLLASTPHFYPLHLKYAVERGKNVFIEKPVAVDAPGVRNVMESCRIAKEKGLSIVSGLCWRYDLGVRATMQHVVDEKAIGDIVAIESSYNSGTLWHRGDNPAWSRMEYQLRNWIYHKWLSGDHILEQAVHSLDKTAWLLGDIQPTTAMALGGRQQRTDPMYGDVYDHFTVFYEYPTGQRVYFTCRQQEGTSTRVEEVVLGTGGQAEVLAHRVEANGGKRWAYDGPKPSMYFVEHQELFQSIREGKPINNGHYMCNSTMIGVMGRMAAYSGKTIKWDECFNSDERLGPHKCTWDDAPEPQVAIPGRAVG